jgi:hypothetical protein
MPDDTHQTSRADERGPEKSCEFGSCTFVKEWYDKVGKVREAEGNTGTTTSGLSAELCSDCSGLFFGTTTLLQAIKPGAMDKMEQPIQQVYLSGEDYTIYRTEQGVYAHFADCRWCERKQRVFYSEISEKLCRLRFLTSQIARWPLGLSSFNTHGGFYDHQVAEALYLALQKKPDREKARKILDEGLRPADDRLTNENRTRYLIACLFACLLIGVPSIFTWRLYGSTAPLSNETWIAYLMAGAAGSVGAMFSIAIRIRYPAFKPCFHSVMNYLMGPLRVLTGFVAGSVILLIVNGTVLGEGIRKLFETQSMTEPSPVGWKCVVLVGFLGGFAERLVPSLLRTLK